MTESDSIIRQLHDYRALYEGCSQAAATAQAKAREAQQVIASLEYRLAAQARREAADVRPVPPLTIDEGYDPSLG